jgi:hypothetical protein
MEVGQLCAYFRESLRTVERTAVSSYVDKLLEVNTVGFRDIILLLQVVIGFLLNYSVPFL